MTDEVIQGAQDTPAAPASPAQSDGSLLTPPAQPATEATAPEAAKPENEAAKPEDAKPAALDEYADFTLADGMEMNQEVLADFKGMAKELGLTQEAAQKLIDLQSRMTSLQSEQTQQALAAQSQAWAKAIREDAEFGGENYEKNVGIAVKAVERFASPELRSLLNDSGLGNHPELVKLFHRIGSAISEDSLVLSGTQASPQEMTIVDAFK